MICKEDHRDLQVEVEEQAFLAAAVPDPRMLGQSLVDRRWGPNFPQEQSSSMSVGDLYC